jgi:hypothetical protein
MVLLSAVDIQAASISGHVYDAGSGNALSGATVQIVDAGRATSTNKDGEFRLLLEPGDYRLKISHIGYYSKWEDVSLDVAAVDLTISLPPAVIELSDLVVRSRAYDPAQAIIVEAIKRKQDILRRLNDYSFDAYSKLVVWDESKEDSSEILLITETQSRSHWEYPDRYKEILMARRQSANLPAEANMVVVGGVLDFNKNRLNIADWQVVSPTATDALNHYNYYLVDSTMIDDRKVFQLDVEPKNNLRPLVVGRIEIADSTFDVIGVDVGFNQALDTPILDSIRYYQRSALFSEQYWMPVEIGFDALVTFNLPLVPSPLRVDFVASLHSYSFEAGHPKGTFDQYVIEVAEDADDIDSTAWVGRQRLTITRAELEGYRRIDSLEKIPEPIYKRVLTGVGAAVAMVTFGNYEWFHFQRVDGPYAGLSLSLEPHKRLMTWLASGYGFDSDYWQHRYGLRYRLWEKYRLEVGAEYRRQIVAREIMGKGWYDPTFEALFFKSDPFDYYREEGFSLFANARVVDHVDLTLKYRDYDQSTESVNTDYAFFNRDRKYRDNPVIADGHLRAVSAELTYDSRRLWLNKGEEIRVDEPQYTAVTVGVSNSSPDMLDSDYDFRKYWASLVRRQRVPALGMSNFTLMAGSATRALPPQEYYTIGFDDPFATTMHAFLTTSDSLFYGNRILVAHWVHDFGRALWRQSRIPLVEDIPFTVTAYGGAFWTDFVNHTCRCGDELLPTAPTAYSEVGFSIGNLTPFIWPLNLAVHFTWQLSDYPTSDFTILLGLRL